MILMLLIRARPAPALELAAGGGLVEQGDDVVRPAAKIHLGFTDHVFMEAVVFGRTFGPVTERSTLLGLAGRAALFGGTGLLGRFGLTVLDEYTAIERTDPDRAVLAEQSIPRFKHHLEVAERRLAAERGEDAAPSTEAQAPSSWRSAALSATGSVTCNACMPARSAPRMFHSKSSSIKHAPISMSRRTAASS